jgi:hypothetical protein
MASPDVEALRRLLAEASGRAESLAQEPQDEPTGAGYFAASDGGVEDAVRTVAEHDDAISLFVGAGVSMEAGLPPWGELVARLLEGVATELDGEDRAEWVWLTLEEGPLAAAAVARSLYGDEVEFRRALRRALYADRAPGDYAPGALAGQIAWLKQRLGPRLRVLTANFDGLLEQALGEVGLDAVSYVRARNEPDERAAVWHLHGRLMQNRTGRDWLSTGQLVLAEGDYVQSTYATWPQEYVADRLRDSLCVFVGLSMTDPNFIRWLYRYGPQAEHEHLALFVRQGAPATGRAVRAKLEAAAAARWRRSGVTPIWTNYYGEVAQLIHEAGLRAGGGEPTERFRKRAASRLAYARDLLQPAGPDDFAEAQRDTAAWLRERVEDVRRIGKAHGVDLSGEDLGLGLWVADHERGVAELWATSESVAIGRDAIEARPIHVASRWVGIEAITRGIPLEQDPAVYTTRWRFVRGIPIIVDPLGERSVVGAITLTSVTPIGLSPLAAANAGAGLLPEIDRSLSTSAADFFVP